MKSLLLFLVALTLLARSPAQAGVFDSLLSLGQTNKATPELAKLTQGQVGTGLKEALSNGVQHAVSTLGQTNGFLTNASVRIPMPEKLRTVETTLRALRQQKLADEFVATMNHAAEQAVPQAARLFGEALSKMSMADAKAILTGPDNAATEYFRKTTQTNLVAKFLPVVKQATAKAGVTASYKSILDKANSFSLGSLGTSMLGTNALDIDLYITDKATDGLFIMVAAEEKRIRGSTTARTTELMQQVFSAVKK